MNIPKDIIIYFVKLCVMSIFSYYCFRKITNSKKSKFGILILVFIVSVILGSICTYIKFFINQFLSVIVLCLLYGIILGTITKNKIGYSLITTIISYAICLVLFVISTTIEFILYKLFVIKDDYINLLIIALVQFGLIWSVFKIRKFKNGFDFLYKKINNDFFDIIMINVSVAVILVYCLIGTIFEEIDEITKNLSSAFIILVITMGIILPKTLKMYYKQKLLEDTMEEYEDEIEKKDAEIKKLKNEKLKISKISHEFYNRQKALELLVKETNGMKSEMSEEIVSKNVLEMVKSLTKEYSEEFIKTKNLPKLEETGIPEIDELYILTYNKDYKEYKAYMEGSALVDAQVKVIEYFMGDTSDGKGYIDSNRNLGGEVEYSFDIIDVIKDELDSGTYKYVQECSAWNGEELVPTEITNIGPDLCFARKVADSEDPNEYYIENANVDASFNMVWADIGDAIKMRWKYARENNIELVQYNNGYIENVLSPLFTSMSM